MMNISMFGLFNSHEEKHTQDVIGDVVFKRFEGNPILKPNTEFPWKAKAVYNPAAIYLDNKIHLIYRGQAHDGVSCLGYATSRDGLTIEEDLEAPIYRPSASFELPTKQGWNSGCEDPRITQVDDRLIITYTAYDGTNPPRIAMTSISTTDFLEKRWIFEAPRLISPPGVDDKDCCIVENGSGYTAYHRLGNSLWMDSLRDLDFPEVKFLTGGILATPRSDHWDNLKIGLAAPPLEIDEGLLLFYHALCNPGFKYQIGVMLLDKSNPHKIIARSNAPLLSPTEYYETHGQVTNIVFSCGAILINDTIYMYYGGADTVTGVATIPLQGLLASLLQQTS